VSACARAHDVPRFHHDDMHCLWPNHMQSAHAQSNNRLSRTAATAPQLVVCLQPTAGNCLNELKEACEGIPPGDGHLADCISDMITHTEGDDTQPADGGYQWPHVIRRHAAACAFNHVQTCAHAQRLSVFAAAWLAAPFLNDVHAVCMFSFVHNATDASAAAASS
jgi:hypothetical protein